MVSNARRDISAPPKASWGFSTTTISFALRKVFVMCVAFSYTVSAKLTFFDIGGHEKIRKIWKNYYADVYGCIFLVDSNNRDRIAEAKTALHDAVSDPRMRDKPLLIVSNKKLDGNLSVSELAKLFEVEGLISIVECDLEKDMTGLAGGTSLKPILGVQWLIHTIDSNYINISRRVVVDVKQQELAWKEERLLKMREKLAREEAVKSNTVHPA